MCDNAMVPPVKGNAFPVFWVNWIGKTALLIPNDHHAGGMGR